jgi:ribosome-binding factor A
MKQTEATRRLAQEAREKIATILLTEFSDPRLSMVTVTGCEVSVDRSVCKVWVAAPADSYEEVMAGLASAKGRIRSLLGRSLTWRVTPELIFAIDRSTDEAMRIAEALKNVPPTMAVPKDEFGYPLADAEAGEDGQGE